MSGARSLVSKISTLLACLGIAACAGGGSGSSSNASDVGVDDGHADHSSLTLYEMIKQNPFTPLRKQGAVGGGDAKFENSFDITVEGVPGGPIAFDHTLAEPFKDGAQLYRSADGSDLAVATAPPANGDPGVLTFTTFGIWAATERPGFVDETNWTGPVTAAQAFYGGVPTPPQNMPNKGTATYGGSASALEVDATTSELVATLGGGFRANVDFGAGTVEGHASLHNLQTGRTWGWVDTGKMRIVDGAAGFRTGLYTNSSKGHIGTATGEFLGPHAEELGGTFEVANATSRVVGSFGAKR